MREAFGERARALVRSYRVTPLGGAFLLILSAAVVVLVVGPRHDEAPAFIVIVIVLAIVVTSAIGPNYRSAGKSLEERREEVHPKRRRLGEAPEPGAEPELWTRERERYEAPGAEGEPPEPGAFGG